MANNHPNKTTKAKEKIILSAEILFGANGFQSTSINQILDHAQVSKGAFYHHFTTKEDLIPAIVDFEHHKNQTIPSKEITYPNANEKFKGEISRWFQALQSTQHLLSWMVPLMAHPVLKNKITAMEPEAEMVKKYLEELLSEMDIPNPAAEAEFLFYFFSGLKLQLSIFPETDLHHQEQLILNKYLNHK